MKFFPKFISCYRAAAPQSPSSPRRLDEAFTVRSSRVHPNRVHRNRFSGSRSESVTQWRPKLSVIAEDSVVEFAEKIVRDEKKSTAKPRTIASIYLSDESRRNSMAIMSSAFSPTPFMF